MNANDTDINALLKLQELDLSLLKVKKQFDELPQRQTILQAREQRKAVLEKKEKIAAAKADLEKKVAKIMNEDEHLAVKMTEVQAAIDAAGRDYRNLESRTKELAGHERRRGVLADQLGQLTPQVDKVNAMEQQVDKMLAQLQATEEKAIASFQQQGGALQSDMAEMGERRNQLKSQVSPDLAALYEKVAKSAGGVAIGALTGDKCGVCRVTLDPARLVDVRTQAPLGRCPYCKRLLVVTQ